MCFLLGCVTVVKLVTLRYTNGSVNAFLTPPWVRETASPFPDGPQQSLAFFPSHSDDKKGNECFIYYLI